MDYTETFVLVNLVLTCLLTIIKVVKIKMRCGRCYLGIGPAEARTINNQFDPREPASPSSASSVSQVDTERAPLIV